MIFQANLLQLLSGSEMIPDKIRITRDAWYGSFRKVYIYIDNKKTIGVRKGEIKEIYLPKNFKKIHAGMDWEKTNTLYFDEFHNKTEIQITHSSYVIFKMFIKWFPIILKLK